jgi:peroxiredoxin
MKLGSAAPAFDLPGVDGASHSLDEYGEATLLVLVQSCNHCPYVQAWEERLMAVTRDYEPRGVRVVAINSNDAVNYPEDSFEEMRRRAQQRGFPFDYLHDEDQSVAHALDSTRTPEVFVFDGKRLLRYHGAIDDSHDDRSVTTRYLQDALDALLDGRQPPVAETPPVGCSMKWK